MLDSLIFATRFALDLREFPIRKVDVQSPPLVDPISPSQLLLCDLLLWRTTLEAPDRWLYLMTPNTPEKGTLAIRCSEHRLPA